MKKTKKIHQGLYLHLETSKYITAFVGSSSTCWNIFNDRDCVDEFWIGFNTKWQAVEYLDTLIEKE